MIWLVMKKWYPTWNGTVWILVKLVCETEYIKSLSSEAETSIIIKAISSSNIHFVTL